MLKEEEFNMSCFYNGMEEIIRKNWSDFRAALANREFSFDEVEKAKSYTFLKTYDDLFYQNSGIKHKTIRVKDLEGLLVGRGTILSEKEVPDYGRFIPKSEFIKKDNRFSPSGVEWLYLALGNEADIHECAQAECRAKKGDRFGFCHFSFLENSLDLKLVDLTVVNNISYDDLRLDSFFEGYTKKQLHDGKKFVNIRVEMKEIITKWGAYLYTKLLSEQIFKPLSDKDDKELMYAPFQTMSQYYISLGYSGIIYGSTVSNLGRNIVLFDKNVAHPIGIIEDYILK